VHDAVFAGADKHRARAGTNKEFAVLEIVHHDLTTLVEDVDFGVPALLYVAVFAVDSVGSAENF